MPFTIPDKGEGANDLQSVFFQEYIDILVAGLQGVDCVISGCAVTAQGAPDMTVAVASGNVNTNGVYKAVTGANGTITAADATNPRLDLVVITSAGAIAVRAGTSAASPKPPAKTANDVILAVVYIPATDTTISTNQITDLRVMRSLISSRFATVPLTDGATVSIDPTKSHDFFLSGSVGRSLDMTAAGYEGQRIVISWKNTGGSPITHALVVGGTDDFRYLGTANALNSTAAGVSESIAVKYHLIDAKWDVIGYSGADFPAATVDYSYLAAIGGYF